ncbi:MAG TPA: hypothetical protein VJY62_01095, partial [Bacteroidia bacterium]|nr:hypothetical protein [Bacteroidia bacterium]
MLHYKTKNGNNGNSGCLPDCCKEIIIDDPKGCDCCYDDWTADLKGTTCSYKEWNARVDKLSRHYTIKTEWRDKLKTMMDDLTKTNEKASDIFRQLLLFIKHLEKLCNITEQSNKSIRILFCMIEDLYIRVDGLKKDYDILMTCINNASKTNPELSPGTGVIKCLEEYGKKLDAVLSTRDNLITLATSAIEIAFKLHESLCKDNDNCGEGKLDYGLINIIEYWRDIFIGQKNENCGTCIFEPGIKFPIDQSDYFNKINADFNVTNEKVERLKKKLDEAKSK